MKTIEVDVDGKPYDFEVEQEGDGRHIAEVPSKPGVMNYGDTEEEAIANTKALLRRVLEDEALNQ